MELIIRPKHNRFSKPKKVKDFIYSDSHIDQSTQRLFDSYQIFKKNNKINGRFMIKIESIEPTKYCNIEYMLKHKRYFCSAQAGIRLTENRKDTDIFRVDDIIVIRRMARQLAEYFGNGYVVSIIDRYQNGHHLYVITKQHDDHNYKVRVN